MLPLHRFIYTFISIIYHEKDNRMLFHHLLYVIML